MGSIAEKFSSLKSNLRYDVLSGFIVSLIALPLCLGVASASSFPPIAGVLCAIIGGIFISIISGSELAIKGPAAGLIVIVAGAVDEFGKGNIQEGYMLTASLVALTGLMQIILGISKVGKWADFIPSPVVHGMLAAIGIIIISKQIHLLVGIDAIDIKSLKPMDLILRIPYSLINLEWHKATLGLSCIVLLFILPKARNPLIKLIPSFLIVIVFAIIVVQIFHFGNDTYTFYDSLLNPGELKMDFFFKTSIFYPENLGITLKYFLLLTIIGTIESTLTVKAVDILDPHKRVSNYNKDIVSIGIGNIFSGLLGGLPMISEVARSSANINNKAETRLSGIIHGLFLLVFVLVLVSIIKLIPLVALSSILIFVGLKLASPKEFIDAYKISNEHLIVFGTTTIITLLDDLLIGVMAGVAVKIFINFLWTKDFKELFSLNFRLESTGNQHLLILQNEAVFTNWIPFKNKIESLGDKKIIVDFSSLKLIDTTFIENIHRYKENFKGELRLQGLHELRPVKDHPDSMRVKSSDGRSYSITLNPYQLKLKEYAESNRFVVSLGSGFPKNYLRSFKGFKHTDLLQSTIYISNNSNEMKFEYIECIAYDSINMIEFPINAFIFQLNNKPVPRFLLQKETKFSAVLDLIFKNQVIFESHPDFNQKYSVYSKQTEKVNELFSPAILKYFEENDLGDTIIEGSETDHKIIIYNNKKESDISGFEYKLKTALTFSRLIN